MFESLDDRVRGGRELTWSRISLPIKLFFAFAISSYAAQMYFTYAPPSSHLRPGSLSSFILAYLTCPVCIFTPTVDPTPADIAYFIGPINAAIHGMVGAAIGYIIDTFF